MTIEIKYENDTAFVTVIGNIDTYGGVELSEKFIEITDNPRIKNAKLDLKGVKQINSAGIGKILKFYKHFENKKGYFEIIHVSDKVLELFQEINLHKIINISK